MKTFAFLSTAAAVAFSAALAFAAPSTPESHVAPHVLQSEIKKIADGMTEDQRALFNFWDDFSLGVSLKEGDWKKSWQEPMELTPSLGLYRGNAYLLGYFQKSLYVPNSMEIRKDIKPISLVGQQPVIHIAADSTLSIQENAGASVLLDSLLATQKQTLRLYRGSNLIELEISRYFSNLINTRKATEAMQKKDWQDFAAILKKLAANPVLSESKDRIKRWAKWATDAEKKNPTIRAAVIDGVGRIGSAHGGPFTSPSIECGRWWAFKVFNGGEPNPDGAVIIYDIPVASLTPEIRKQIHVGIESHMSIYLELGFLGPEAKELLIKSLSKEAMLKP